MPLRAIQKKNGTKRTYVKEDNPELRKVVRITELCEEGCAGCEGDGELLGVPTFEAKESLPALLDTRGQQAYGFRTEIKLKSEILAKLAPNIGPAKPSAVKAGKGMRSMRNLLLRHKTTLRVSLAALLVVAAAGRATATGSMATARYGHTATLLADGTVLVVGGIGGDGEYPASAEIYDPVTGTFFPTGSLAGRAYHTATLLADGTVLVVGGRSRVAVLGNANIYDPATGAFPFADQLRTGRYAHAAARLADGTVLVVAGAGGATFQDILASAQIYDPVTGTFSLTGSLATARSAPTATLLADGTVLVVGGIGGGGLGTVLASAEIYDPVTGTWR